MTESILVGIGALTPAAPEVSTATYSPSLPDIGDWLGGYKYVIHHIDNKMLMYRYGELWRDETGDSVILGLVTALAEREQRIAYATNCLVCAAIAPMDEIIDNTLEILGGVA